MSVYMIAQLDPFKFQIYVDPWCAWSVGTISPISDGACPGNCCSGAIEVFGVDQTPPNGFFYGYDESECSPYVPTDDTYLQDEDPSDTDIASIVAISVKKHIEGDKKKSLWSLNYVYSICGMLAVGLLVGGVLVNRYDRSEQQEAYRIIPDEIRAGIEINPGETTSLYHPQPQKIEDL